eukprot:TRINITY_DN458_c0_g1_i1.p1 TRINITY_DN458_c0_g1~~TRINITY_DN458_c0_g1_i1.p1  ORF type:complete len:527 (+),score=79.31 TRINITY_DN458_c0_g1_i1:3479-5059(+)
MAVLTIHKALQSEKVSNDLCDRSLKLKLFPIPTFLRQDANREDGFLEQRMNLSPEALEWVQQLDRGSSYKGFGSFHSDNVEEMIRIPDETYVEPLLPFEWNDPAEFSLQAKNSLSVFGKEFGRNHFLLDPSFTFLNHGAFGASLKSALTLAERWRRYTEEQPLRMIDRQLFPHLVRCLRQMSHFVGCKATNLVFTQNATTGFNAVLRSVPLTVGDAVFALDISYGSLKKLAKHICSVQGANYVEASIPMICLQSEDAIVSFVTKHLPINCKLAIFDHITSNTAVILPVEKLVRLCQQRGIRVLIDGAHTLITLPLHLDSLGADYYIANCHKWFSCPKGVGLLYVSPKHQASFHHVIASHGYLEGLTSEFLWDGTRDYSSALSISAALTFWKQVGISQAQAYITSLKESADAILRAPLSTSWLVPLDRCGWMACLLIPHMLVKGIQRCCQTSQPNDTQPIQTGEDRFSSKDTKLVQDYLHYVARVEVPAKLIDGEVYLRISMHLYNDKADLVRLYDAITNPVLVSRL